MRHVYADEEAGVWRSFLISFFVMQVLGKRLGENGGETREEKKESQNRSEKVEPGIKRKADRIITVGFSFVYAVFLFLRSKRIAPAVTVRRLPRAVKSVVPIPPVWGSLKPSSGLLMI